MRVAERREHAATARRSTRSGVGSAVSLVPTPPTMRSPAIASAAAVGSDGSIVRASTPFVMITGESLQIVLAGRSCGLGACGHPSAAHLGTQDTGTTTPRGTPVSLLSR